MGDAEEPPAEGVEAAEANDGPAPNMLRIEVTACRGLPEETKTQVSYSYRLVPNDEGEEGDEDPLKVLKGETAEFEEAPAGTEHKYGYVGEHDLPPVSDDLLYSMIRSPLTLSVAGLPVPGKVQVPLVDLIWRPDPKPDDPDTLEYLPGWPGAFVFGWYKVEQGEGELAEGQTFPENAEVFVRAELTNLLLEPDELAGLNVIDLEIPALHSLPALWGPAEGEDVDAHAYVYSVALELPCAGGPISLTANPCRICPPAPQVPHAEDAAAEAPAEGGADSGGEETAPMPAEGGEAGGEGGEVGGEGDEAGAEGGDAGGDGGGAEADDGLDVQGTNAKASVKREREAARLEVGLVHRAVLRRESVAALRAALQSGKLEVAVSRALRSAEAYVYERKYKGVATFDADALLQPGAVATTARVSVQAGADFALPTEEELEATPPPGGEPEPDEGEISPYAAADTYLVLSLALKDPLVPKPPTPAPKVPDVRDLIETHAPLDTAPRPRSAEARLRADCRKIVDALADDYRDLFMLEDGQAVQVESSEERRKQAVFHLNASGRYYDFKERIKRSVQLLVHERLMKLKETCYEDLELIVRKCPETHHPLTSGHVHGRFNTPACGKCAQIVEEEGLGLDELDPTSDHGKRFLSNLYASIQETLNAEMHALFNPKPEVRRGAYAGEELDKMLADELRLAVEAQINRNVALCESHLNKRVAASPHDAQLWYDFGRMALQNGSFEKAQDCLREALAIDPRHVPALLAYGVYLCRHDRFADAESYFLGATLCDPGDVTARAMLVLFYDMESRDLDRRAALKKVLDLEAGAGAPPRSAYLRAAALCVELKALALVERCQAQEVLKRGDSQELRLLVARALMADGKHEAARAQLQAALAEDRRCAGAMLLMGHSLFEEDGWARARCDIPRGGSGREPIQWFERGRAQSAPVPAHMREPHHELLSSLHLAKLYIATGRPYDAKEVLLQACRVAPSCTTFLGLGIACFRQGEIDQAQEALAEANLLDPRSPEAWGMICVVCMTKAQADTSGKLPNQDAEEGEMALRSALRLGLGTDDTFAAPEFILEQIGALMLAAGKHACAVQATRQALGSSQKPSLNILLARTLVQMNDLAAAIDAYQSVVRRGYGEEADAETRALCLANMLVIATILSLRSEMKAFTEELEQLGLHGAELDHYTRPIWHGFGRGCTVQGCTYCPGEPVRF